MIWEKCLKVKFFVPNIHKMANKQHNLYIKFLQKPVKSLALTSNTLDYSKCTTARNHSCQNKIHCTWEKNVLQFHP